MAAAAADLEARQRGGGLPPVAAVATPAASQASAPSAEVTPFPSADERNARAARKTSPATWACGSRPCSSIVLLGAWNLLLQGQLSAAQTYEDNVAAVLEVASQPGAFTAVLAPTTSGGPRGLAAMSPSGDMADGGA